MFDQSKRNLRWSLWVHWSFSEHQIVEVRSQIRLDLDSSLRPPKTHIIRETETQSFVLPPNPQISRNPLHGSLPSPSSVSSSLLPPRLHGPSPSGRRCVVVGPPTSADITVGRRVQAVFVTSGQDSAHVFADFCTSEVGDGNGETERSLGRGVLGNGGGVEETGLQDE